MVNLENKRLRDDVTVFKYMTDFQLLWGLGLLYLGGYS